MPTPLAPTTSRRNRRATRPDLAVGAPTPPGRWRRALRRLLSDPVTATALTLLLLIVIACLAAGLVSAVLGVSPDAKDLRATFQGPSSQHLMGTDHLGRDVLARLLYGGRVSLAIGVLGALVAMTVGVAMGMIAATLRGAVDVAAMWLVNTLQSIPVTFFLLVVAFVFSPSVFWIVVLLGFLAWTDACRMVRGQSLSVDATDYVLAARALGASNTQIMWRHMLPNVLPYVVVSTTIVVGELILFESALSFLGLGVKPPTATWGRMLSEAEWSQGPHLVLLPGLAITVTVLCLYTLGDGLRDALDPRQAP